MRVLRAFVTAAVIGPVAGVGLAVGTTTPAWAASPGIAKFALTSFGPTNHGPQSCPAGAFVAVNPGPQQSPGFLLVQPGPANCPAGIDVLLRPGPLQSPQGEAVALPLTAADCQAGTGLFTQELALIGGNPAGGLPGAAADPASACPTGDAAFAALEAALATVPTVAPGPGTFFYRNPGPTGFNFVTVNPSPVQAPRVSVLYGQASIGREVIVAFLEGDPDTPILVGSANGTAGVAMLKVPCHAPCA